MNCLMAPILTGPRHMTGASFSGRRNAMDMILRDGGTVTGTSCLWSLTVSCSSSTPNILGMLGPVISMSMIPVWYPFMDSAAARLEDTVLLPTPPFPLMTMMTCLMFLRVSWSLVSSWMVSSVSKGFPISIPLVGIMLEVHLNPRIRPGCYDDATGYVFTPEVPMPS